MLAQVEHIMVHLAQCMSCRNDGRHDHPAETNGQVVWEAPNDRELGEDVKINV